MHPQTSTLLREGMPTMANANTGTFDYPFSPSLSRPWALTWTHRIGLEAKYRLRRAPRRSANSIELTRLGNRPFWPLSHFDMPLVFLSHNSLRYMPSFLRHYRSMGVTRFICVDDQSNDGTREFLLTQEDTDVYASNVRYSDAGRGKIWREKLFEIYGRNRWYLNVDSDEYFVYETLGEESIQHFADRLRKARIRRIPSTMLDLYPIDDQTDSHFDGHDETMPWEVATHFDGDGYRAKVHAKGVSVSGGVRCRVFGSQETELVKYPLIFWDRHCSLGRTIHSPLPAKLNFAPVMACLLHFKIFSSLRDDVEQVVANGQHFQGAIYYRRWLEVLDQQRTISCGYDQSVAYAGPRDLVRRGFILPLDDRHRQTITAGAVNWKRAG